MIEVVKRYKLEKLLMFPVESGTLGYQALKKAVGGNGSGVVYARSGRYACSGLLYLDILYPSDEKLSYFFGNKGCKVLWVAGPLFDLNDLLIVANMGLGNFEALMTRDLDTKVAKEIIESGLNRKDNCIKIPHHGSRNGLAKKFLKTFEPEVEFVSVDKNQWGHSHEEVLEMLPVYGLGALRDEMRDIEIVTDGEKWRISN